MQGDAFGVALAVGYDIFRLDQSRKIVAFARFNLDLLARPPAFFAKGRGMPLEHNAAGTVMAAPFPMPILVLAPALGIAILIYLLKPCVYEFNRNICGICRKPNSAQRKCDCLDLPFHGFLAF